MAKAFAGKVELRLCPESGKIISGVQALEEASFRGAVMGAVKASFEKTKKM